MCTHVWVQAEVLPTTESDPPEAVVLATHLLAVGHQPLELRERLLDLGHRSRAVDQLPVGGVELGAAKMEEISLCATKGGEGGMAAAGADLLVGDDEGEQGDRLARPRRHL